MDQTMCTSRPFLLNLPSEVIINILTRLPVRTILSCKCVCKQLLNLLSTPDFAASHLPLSTPALLVLQYCRNQNLCQVFEFDDGFELQHDNLNFGPVMKFDLNVSLGLPNVDLRIVGSVDGLLCLREEGNKVYDALYICNLITREYIALPKIEAVNYKWCSEYGFGVSKISGQYKVVRKVHRVTRKEAWTAQHKYNRYLVYTVGTRSWRNVEPTPPFGQYHSFSLFMNGNLHGSVHKYYDADDMLISCFDLESELSKPFPLPPPPDSPIVRNLGILDDCLCFFSISEFDGAIWMMKEYGVEKSWTQLVVLNNDEGDEEGGFSCTDYDSVWPIKAFKNGDILLKKNDYNLFCFSNTTKTCRNVTLMIQKELPWIDARSHTLSFLSLKSFDGENVIPFS